MHRRGTLLSALVIALVAVPTGGDQCLQAQPTYPSWFQRTPSARSSVLWAVGYAPAYLELADGVEEAKASAYESLRRSRRLVVIGEKLYEAAPGFATSVEGEAFIEIGQPDTLRAVTYVDSVRAAGMTLVLAAWGADSAASLSISSGSTPFPEEAPPWVKNGLRGAVEGRRAVGIAPRYYSLENSWRRAEERARRQLAFDAATSVRTLNKKTEEWRHNVRSVTTGVDLREVQVLARWADEEYCYVLTKGLVEDVLIK